MHRVDVLLGELRRLGVHLPPSIARRLRRSNWSTDLRYESANRDAGETAAFLKTAKTVYDWAEGQLP